MRFFVYLRLRFIFSDSFRYFVLLGVTTQQASQVTLMRLPAGKSDNYQSFHWLTPLELFQVPPGIPRHHVESHCSFGGYSPQSEAV